jgi:DNA polymerase-1
MQGSAADIIKRAMIEEDAGLQAGHRETHLIMQVHDELVLEVPEDDLETIRAGVVERMSGAAELDVPLVVDAGHGPDWDSAH